MPTNLLTIFVVVDHRHYCDFVLTISQHPNGLYDDVLRHPLIYSIKNAQRITQVSDETFEAWCKEVSDGFAINNFMALPIQSLPPDMAQSTKVDPRSLYDRFNHICTSTTEHIRSCMIPL